MMVNTIFFLYWKIYLQNSAFISEPIFTRLTLKFNQNKANIILSYKKIQSLLPFTYIEKN